MAICGKRSSDPLVARRAHGLDRCDTCAATLGHCVVGEELTGICAYNVIGPSIQVLKGRPKPKSRRYLVAVFVWGITLNRAFVPTYYRSRGDALTGAIDRAIHLTGGPVEPWCGDDYMAGPRPGFRVPVLVAR